MRHGGKAKVGSLTLPRNLNYTTRANISHEIAEQIRARIACTPAEKWVAGVNLICALTGWRVHLCFCLLAVLGLYLVGVGAYDDPRRSIKKLFSSRAFE